MFGIEDVGDINELEAYKEGAIPSALERNVLVVRRFEGLSKRCDY